MLHRDIKPSNILLQQDGHTKITDFGIAKSFDIRPTRTAMTDDMTMTGFVLGTPGYLAPERRAGSPATVQSDLYSVGAVMVEALTGQRLGPGRCPDRAPAPPLRDVARRAMAPDPRDRFSVRERDAAVVADGRDPDPAGERSAPPATFGHDHWACQSGPPRRRGGTAALDRAAPRPLPQRTLVGPGVAGRRCRRRRALLTLPSALSWHE